MDIEDILKESRERQKKRDETLIMSDEEVEKMEAELLRDQERINTTLFEGKILPRSNKDISDGTPSPYPLIPGPSHLAPFCSL